jgi:hypothetical protein
VLPGRGREQLGGQPAAAQRSHLAVEDAQPLRKRVRPQRQRQEVRPPRAHGALASLGQLRARVCAILLLLNVGGSFLIWVTE